MIAERIGLFAILRHSLILRVNDFGKNRCTTLNYRQGASSWVPFWKPRSISCWFPKKAPEAPTNGGKPPDLSTWQFFFQPMEGNQWGQSIRDQAAMDPGPMGALGQVVKHRRQPWIHMVLWNPQKLVGQISIMVGISELLSLSWGLNLGVWWWNPSSSFSVNSAIFIT